VALVTDCDAHLTKILPLGLTLRKYMADQPGDNAHLTKILPLGLTLRKCMAE
jgi:hypothetical protein